MRRQIVAVAAVVLFSFAISLGSTRVLAAAIQWSGNAHWYEAVLVPGGTTWTDAENAATSMGGYLATITSEPENDFVYSLISDNSNFWIPLIAGNGGPWLGGYRAESNWAWVTGEPWSYTDFAPGEPNNWDGIENRLQYFQYQGNPTDPTWNDIADDGEVIERGFQLNPGYIVEFNSQPAPEPSTLVLIGTCTISLLTYAWRRRIAK